MTKATAIYVMTSLQVGGAQKALLNLLTSPLQQQYPAQIISLMSGSQDLQAAFERAGVPCEVLPLKKPWRAIKPLLKLLRTCRTYPPVFIHGWMHHGNVFAALLWYLTGRRARLLWSMHHTPEKATFRRWHHALILKLGRLLSHWPERIIYVSERSLQSHIALGFASHHAKIIPNGIHLDTTCGTHIGSQAARQSLGIAADAFVIGSLTRFVAEKDIPNLLKATALFKSHCPQLVLLLAGEGMAMDNAALQQWIAQYQLQAQVRLLGVRADVAPLIASMDIASLSSRREAFPLFLAEAMAQCVPVVATEVGDIAECVADTGFIVPRENAAALAQAWLHFYQLNPAQRNALGQAAQQRIEEKYNMKQVIAAYEEVLNDTL